MAEMKTPQEQPSEDISPIRALGRMLLGGSVLAIDAFMRQVHTQVELQSGVVQEDDFVHAFPPADEAVDPQQDLRLVKLEDGLEDGVQTPLPITELQYILGGMAVDIAGRLGRITNRAGRVVLRSSQIADRVVSPAARSRLMGPFNRRFDRLVERGEHQLDTWRELGRHESEEGADLLGAVVLSSVNNSVEYVSQQPEVLELATMKGASFGQRILTFVRRTFVTIDTVIEGIARRILRMTPRYMLDPPDDDLRESAGRSRFEPDQAVELVGTHTGYYAGIASRITAKVIDLLLVSISFNITAWFIRTSIEFMGINPSTVFSLPFGSSVAGGLDLNQLVAVSTLSFTFFVLYHTLLWALFGQTIGTAIMGLRVISVKGELPGLLRSWLRVTFGYAISIASLGIGLWMIVFTKRRQALHDVIFGTFVLYTWDARPSDRFLLRLEERYGSPEDLERIEDPERSQL